MKIWCPVVRNIADIEKGCVSHETVGGGRKYACIFNQPVKPGWEERVCIVIDLINALRAGRS